MSDTPSITCPQCSMTSYHPTDIEMGWCSNCKGYTSPVNPLMTAKRVVEAAERAKFVADTAAVDQVRTFTCAMCGGVFVSTLTEAESNREFLTSGIPNDGSGLASVCDTCYELAMTRAKELGLLNDGDT